MSDTIMKELTEAVHYAYRLGYVSADRAHEMQLIIESIVDERDIAKADVEKIVTYNTRLQDALDQARAEVERLTKERDEALAKINGQKDALLEAARQVTDAAFQQAEIERLKRELEQAIAERTPHDYGLQKCEIANLKQALHDARLENSGQAAEIEKLKEKVDQLQYIADFEKAHLFKRQEPSRLEIAAMLKAAWLSNADYKSEDRCDEGWWIEQADALIAAAKGGAK
jgi:chromosome segregation ATPase